MRNTARWLAEARRRWADRPSSPPDGVWPLAPAWAELGFSAYTALEHTGQTWRTGEVRWAFLVAGAAYLWEGSSDPGHALLAWSDDPLTALDPYVLSVIRERYWWVREGGRRPDRRERGLIFRDVPGWREVRELVSNDAEWFMGERVPPLLTPGLVAYLDRTILYPKELPGGAPHNDLLLVVRGPLGSQTSTRILPLRFWPRDMLERWQEKVD